MQKSRLIEIFEALPTDDHKKIKKFVRSPFFNQREHVIKLYAFLLSRYKNKQTLDRQVAFEYIWPQEKYDDHKLRLSMSLLLKVLEKYLVWKELQDEDISFELKLSQAYRKLGLDRQFNKNIKFIDDKLEQQVFRHADYYQNRYLLHLEQYQYLSGLKRMEDIELEKVQQNFDLAFLASKLKQSCFALSHQAVYKKEYQFGMLPQIISYIEENDFLKHPAIAIYYYTYKALTQEEEHTHFKILKEHIFKYQKLFPKSEIRDLFLLAANYCIKQLNKGYNQFSKEGLEIYKEGLKNDILLLNGSISNFTYSNIVAKAILNKDYDWAANFVHEYKDKLEKKNRISCFSFNLAWLEYERKDYVQALDLIQQTHFNDVHFNISAKIICLKIYYEMDAFDLLYAHLDAMRTFINRKNSLVYHKENYLNTIKFTKKILDLPPRDNALKKALQQEIEQTKVIAERKWLIAQIEK